MLSRTPFCRLKVPAAGWVKIGEPSGLVVEKYLLLLLPGIPGKLLEDMRTSVLDPELPLGGIRTATEAADLANAGVVVVRSHAARLPRLEL